MGNILWIFTSWYALFLLLFLPTPFFLQVWQTLTSELTFDGWHSSPKVPELSETWPLSFVFSHGLNEKLFCLSSFKCDAWHLFWGLCSTCPDRHWFEYYCCLQSLQLRPLPSQLSLSPQLQRWSMPFTPENHTNLSPSYLDGYMECHGKR